MKKTDTLDEFRSVDANGLAHVIIVWRGLDTMWCGKVTTPEWSWTIYSPGEPLDGQHICYYCRRAFGERPPPLNLFPHYAPDSPAWM